MSMAPSGVVAAQQEPAALQSRVYDVRDLVHPEKVYLPATVAEAAFESPVSDEAWPAIELGELTEVLRTATSRTYWEGEGVDLRPEDTGLLVLTCDEEMHATARDVLTKLRRVLFEPVSVEVHEVPGSAIAGHAAVLSAAEADAMLGKVGQHRVHVGRADLRRPLLLESKRIQSRVAGMQVRVAQQAAAPDLHMATDVNGASWTVRVERTVGDDLLVTISGSDRAQEKGPVCELPTGAEQGVATLELAVTRIASAHAAAWLHPGQALLVGADSPGGVALCIRPRANAKPTPGHRLGQVTAYPVGAIVRGPHAPGALRVPYEDGTLFPEVDEQMPAVFDDGRLIEWLVTQVAPDTWDESPNSMSYLAGLLFVSAADDVQEQLAEHLQELQHVDARQFSLEVAFGEIPAGQAVAAVAATPEGAAQLAEVLPQRAVTTVSASRFARLSATWHTPYVEDYDCALASGSGVTTPALGSYARGFLMQARAMPMDQGMLQLDLRLVMFGHDAERQLFAMRDPRFASVDRVDVRQNELSGSTAVALGEWTLLRIAPVEGGASSCAVVARVKPTAP
ncbi:MAG: hypothetical protein H6835_11395 [Planctomycetes bacterium]|nr:hypothetical protein [Planctomycetota bacterium]